MRHADPQAGAAGSAGLLDAEGELRTGSGRPTEALGRPSASSTRYRLKRSVELFPAPDGSLYLLRNGATDEFVVDGPSNAERLILESLQTGWIAGARLRKRLSERSLSVEDLEDTLAALADLGLLECTEARPQLSIELCERYDRQLIYFSDLATLAGSAEQLQKRLLDARVLVLGCGGLGSWTACGLACAGVGRLVLVDDDRVELSNLNRQLLFGESDLGELKVDASAKALRRHNCDLDVLAVSQRVESPEDIAGLLEGVDLVIATADWPPHVLPRWVNRSCLEARVPYITAGQFPPLVRIGPMVLPGHSACLECLERQTRRDYPLYDELAAHRARNPTAAPTLGAASGIVGSALAMEAIHYLIGVPQPASVDAALILDLRTMQISREGVERDPCCELCSTLGGSVAGDQS